MISLWHCWLHNRYWNCIHYLWNNSKLTRNLEFSQIISFTAQQISKWCSISEIMMPVRKFPYAHTFCQCINNRMGKNLLVFSFVLQKIKEFPLVFVFTVMRFWNIHYPNNWKIFIVSICENFVRYAKIIIKQKNIVTDFILLIVLSFTSLAIFIGYVLNIYLLWMITNSDFWH